MITGIGTDLVEIARVQKAIGRSAFLERVYTEKERELIAIRSVRAAGNFAAKEAVAKALGCGFAGIKPVEIEVLRESSGLPYVVLHGVAAKKAEEQGITTIRISITDTAEYAQSYAICEREKPEDKKETEQPTRTSRKKQGEEKTVTEVRFPVLDAAGMKAVDRKTIEDIGIPSLVLMERAALSVVECVKEYAMKESRIGVLCGTGNNGGDGVAVARLLVADGFDVTVLIKDAPVYREAENGQEATGAGKEFRGTPEFLQQIKIAKACKVPFCEPENTEGYDILVDALFGIGLSKPVEGAYAALLERINAEAHTVIAVDIASGISASTGAVCGVALRADETVTFGAAKCGQLLYPGKDYTGKLRVAEIGFPKELLWEQKQGVWFAAEGMDAIVPKRPAYSNKGTFGKVTVIAGSKDMAGAAYFAACAAYRTGAGLVKIVTPEVNRGILQTMLPEAMLVTYTDKEEVRTILEEAVAFADALVIGPGLSQTEQAEELVGTVRDILREKKEAAPPSVWDADALNLIAKKMQEDKIQTIEERKTFLETWLPNHAVLTPHPGELSRLLGKPVTELTGSFVAVAKELSFESKLTFVLKDAVTLVANKADCFFNTTGNNGMATGGSGDTLCGVIAALLAGGMDCFSAAAAGVWLHGAAGDAATKEKGAASVIARDIVQAIGDIVFE